MAGYFHNYPPLVHSFPLNVVFQNISSNVLFIIKQLHTQIKAASSDGSPPTGGFRKTGNGKQYAFKNVNIEELWRYVHNCLCPDVFKLALLSNM